MISSRCPVEVAGSPGAARPTGWVAIALSQGKDAIVDEADADAVAVWKWSAARCGRSFYAVRSLARGSVPKKQKLHRFLWERWGLPPAVEIDHINGNGLDNRRSNLRAATRSQNARNQRAQVRTGGRPKGATPWRGRWKAQITTGGRTTYLGMFDTAAQAHAEYMGAARKVFGDFARAS